MDADTVDHDDRGHDARGHDDTPEADERAVLQQRIATSLAASLAETEWAEGDLFWAEIGERIIARLSTLDAAGTPHDHAVPRDIDDLGRALRRAMATPEKGTWFSLSLTLEADGSYTARFNFDRRVYDNPSTPFSAGRLGAVPTDADYTLDLERYPRGARYQPAWLGLPAVQPAPESSVTAPAPAASAAASSAATEVGRGTSGQPLVQPPYDVLEEAWGWPGVFASVSQQITAAVDEREPGEPMTRTQAEQAGRHVLAAVVADVLEPHRLATILTLHAEAVRRRLLPEVPGTSDLDASITLLEARGASSPTLLAVEAGVYGIVGDVVRAELVRRL
ncbi:hypothetical protein AS850_10395 [Frondihabitans sp. 762G35]|uniref:hypothetical protein n=1 Tax=Frondihabitans sp. 762G35 TaxID=1446794 RepID=UPI000D21C3C8|nr:hypothetical protein [Frondihabitans sp. 762G35]ARC57485.1 hypothetical protein AS850_10395 [Frondihabitans sp. 762G35]